MADFFKALETADLNEATPLSEVLDNLRFNTDGLLPAIAQDADSGEVLMLAWMNRAAIDRSLNEGYACYYSRSRQTMWRKGETSGHLQLLKAMRFDCDGDAILLSVQQTGPACHTNRTNCFYLEVQDDQVLVVSEPEA